MIEVNLLVKNLKELINPADDAVVRGPRMNSLRVSRDVWVAATGEEISFIGREDDFNRSCSLAPKATVIDGSAMVACPGLVDPHTHLPFAGTRQEEFRMKLQGVSYQEIARQGGGIKGTVRMTRESEADELISVCERRLDRILLSGTTTLEAKSGYGLDLETEQKQLEVVKALNAFHPVDLVATYMGAHEIPESYQGRPRQFLEFLVEKGMPGIQERGLAEFADIFCEEGYFSYEDAEYYLDQAAAMGFKTKIHADEFTSNNAASLAVEKGAVSAEHLIAITDSEIETLAPSQTAAVLLPGVSFFLKMDRYAPARKMIEHDGIVALGSDFNPGSSMISSQLFIFHLGIFMMGLTVEEAFNAVTINAAYAAGRQASVGSIALGKKMDLVLMDIPDYGYMAYHLGINPVDTVIKAGEVVSRNRQVIYDR